MSNNLNNLTISREAARTAYDNTNDAGRELLENLFGKEVFKDITERVKTFADACKVLGSKHPYVEQYVATEAAFRGEEKTGDFLSYLKLRIITAALNEGWEPQFTEDELRYFPWFQFFTQKELDEMSEDEKGSVFVRTNLYSYAYGGIAFSHANTVSPYSGGQADARLAFKSRELAEYAGRQFAELYARFICGFPFYRKA